MRPKWRIAVAFALAVVPVLAEQGPAVESGTGTINGKVVNSVTGAPVRRALVRMMRGDSRTPTVYEADAGADGSFAITGVEPGWYNASATAQGYVSSTRPGANQRSRIAQAIHVTAGKTAPAATIELTPQAVVTGRVIDEDGDPRAGATVQALTMAPVNGRRQLMPTNSTQANDLGEYRIPGLTEGAYVLVATNQPGSGTPVTARSADGTKETGYVATYYPNAIDAAAAAPIEVKAGEERRGVDIQLAKAVVVRLRGRAVDMTGAGVRAQITLWPAGAAGLGIYSMRHAGPVDVVGTFEVAGLMPGEYAISASLQEPNRKLFATQTLTLTDQRVQTTRLEMRPGITIRGSAKVDGGGETAQSTVILTPRARAAGMYGTRPEHSGPDGSFTLTDVPTANFALNVVSSKGCGVKKAMLGETDVTTGLVDLSNAAGEQALSVVLWQRCGIVAGKVEDGHGNAAKEAMVVLAPEGPARENPQRFVVRPLGMDGQFTAAGVTPGKYVAFAVATLERGSYDDPQVIQDNEKNSVKVTVKEGQTETIELRLRQP